MRLGPRLLATLVGLSAALPAPAEAVPIPPAQRAEQCPAGRSPIMILGTYHMGNPGLDAHNMEADDVLSARRQREIAELNERLAAFGPTKIMLESPYADRDEQQARYKAYLAGTYKLGRNEIDQIGFRLARRLGHASVHPIDYPMFMSGQNYDELDFSVRKPSPPPGAAPAPKPVQPPEIAEAERRLRASTVSDYLAWTNDPGQWRPGHLRYMELFEPEEGNISIYARSDNLVNWYKRNFRMFANIVRTMERPKDRGLLIVGSGHLAILRQLAQDMPGFCLVEPKAYLQPPSG